jgi:hypothetical protein
MRNKNIILIGFSNVGKSTRLKLLITKIANKKHISSIQIIDKPKYIKLKKNQILSKRVDIRKFISIIRKELTNLTKPQKDYVLIIQLGKIKIGICTKVDTIDIFVKYFEILKKENCSIIIIPCNIRLLNSENNAKVIKVLKDDNTIIYGAGSKKQNKNLVLDLFNKI